jgi:polysaccharide biosynthesis/export protein
MRTLAIGSILRSHVFSGFIAASVFCQLMLSCTPSQKIAYFNNISDTTIRAAAINLDPVIQKNDLLSISVSSLNPEASLIFNAPNVSGNTGASTTITGNTLQTPGGYLVSQEGFIQFPILGNIKAAGLTKTQLTADVTKKLIDNKLLVDPIVNIRFQNFRVTVLGEVAHPTVITVPNEKITLLEALGLAGDLTIFAKRENVMLIREEEGRKIIRRINLNTNELLYSPYYYLKSNDILYAEPNKSKIASTNRSQYWLPALLSGLSLIAVIVTQVIN